MKIRWWTSLTFLNYIHEQIAHLSADISQQMSTQLQFTNIVAIEQTDWHPNSNITFQVAPCHFFSLAIVILCQLVIGRIFNIPKQSKLIKAPQI
jgi:ABC-type transporter Mla maintaining outer membrane lipid asymmetry permease subunit MlaE